MATSLLVGGRREDRDSAKQRRKDEYKQDLELQIREKNAARQRERLQDMSVNASGYLDPEKRPDRFKPLGGVHWMEQREKRNDRVRPYHTLFLYDREPHSTYAGAGGNSVDQAYNFFGVRDLAYGTGGGGGGSIVQPISMPHSDNRPIIVTGQGGGVGYQGPRFNPFDRKPDNTSNDYRSLLLITQAEKDRIRRDNEDFTRRLRQELDDERKRKNDQEAEARRRLEELRREAEARRMEAERQRREAERLRKEADKRPKTDPVPRPESKKTMLYYDMDDYRLKLIEERKKIEELLKTGKPAKEVWDLKVVQKPRVQLPPTPKTGDRANKDNVNDFNNLKYRDFNTRNEFRSIYPDVPVTNKRLEQQQEALLRQQEATLRGPASFRAAPVHLEVPPRRAISRPSWMDRNPTPFPHVLKKRDRMYTSHSEGDLDRIHRRNTERERALDRSFSPKEDADLDQLKLRNHRPSSTDTLVDDTWLRPTSAADI